LPLLQELSCLNIIKTKQLKNMISLFVAKISLVLLKPTRTISSPFQLDLEGSGATVSISFSWFSWVQRP
jgi:hypothetical protein